MRGIGITGIGAIGICTIATGVIAMFGGSATTAIATTITGRIIGRMRVPTTARMSIASDCAGGERAALTDKKTPGREFWRFFIGMNSADGDWSVFLRHHLSRR